MQSNTVIDYKRKNQCNISDTLPKMHFVEQGIIRTSANLLMSVIKVNGVHVATQSTEGINEHDDTLNSIIGALSEDFALWDTMVRRKVESSFSVTSDSDFTKGFNNAYCGRFKDAQLYRNDLYLAVIYRGMSSKLAAAKSMGSIFSKKVDERVNFEMQKGCKVLRTKVKSIVSMLGAAEDPHDKNDTVKHSVTGDSFQARILDESETLEHSELMGYLGLFVNGLDDVNYRYPAEPMYGFRDSQASKKSFKKFPHGNLCEFISTNPILTGDNQNIVFKRVDGTEKMANMISVKTYGSGTTPLSFKRLLSVDAEFLLTASFAPIMRGAALRRVSRAVKKLEESNDKAVSQHEAIAQLEDDIASEKVSLGEFHTSVMVLADDEESLETACNEIIKIYGESDFRAVVEVMNHEASFLAQFPTNTQYLTRIRLTPSDVFCHFFPFHNFPTGHTHQTHLGEGLCLIDTPSKTPMWFNFHEPEKGAGENDMCPGHGMIVGGNKAGKTTAMLAFDALSEKYGGRTFFFDRDGGAAIYMWATGNKYFEFDSKNIKKFGLNPFKMPDSPENRAFLVDWLCVLSRNEDEISVPSEIKELMVDVVAHAYEELKDMPSLQNLSGVLKPYLPRNFKRMSNIRLWLKGSGIYEDGAFSDYFDNENDDMDFKSSLKTGFDMTAVLETKDQRLITAVMMYLMHRIMGELDGSLMRIFLDEGWFMLDDPWWQNWLKNKLPTARKENFFIVIGTQSPSSILKSPIASMFLDNSAFSIFFANSKADWNTYDKYNITFAEFQTIKNTSRALRHFIYKQGHDSAVCKFNLSGDQFKKPLKILSTNIKTKELARSLRVEFGNDPKDWLPAFYEDNNEGEKT